LEIQELLIEKKKLNNTIENLRESLKLTLKQSIVIFLKIKNLLMNTYFIFKHLNSQSIPKTDINVVESENLNSIDLLKIEKLLHDTEASQISER
jgi:hypothetical protein